MTSHAAPVSGPVPPCPGPWACPSSGSCFWWRCCRPPTKGESEPARPTSRSVRHLEGWTIRVDDRLLQPPNDELGRRALRFLENKLADIRTVVPDDRLKKLQGVTI